MRKIRFILIYFSVFLTCFTLTGRDYYVSVGTGDDNNNGLSQAMSFKTLPRAKETIRNLIAGGMSENIVVNIDGGNYELPDPLIFTNADSGKSGFQVIYKKLAASAAWPVITCRSRRLTGWMVYIADVQQVEIDYINFNMLYENNVRGIKKTTPQAISNPGDFCISGTMLYYLPRYTPVDKQEIIAPLALADSLIEIRGNSSNDPVRNLVFENLVFTATDYYSLYTAAPGREKGLFAVYNGEKITITGCKIFNAGNTGILLSKGCRNITINNNRVDGFGINGISLTGLTEGDPVYNDAELSYVNHHNAITNNLITSGGGMSSGGAGIVLYQSGENTIVHNSITRLIGSGIRVSGMVFPANSKDNTVKYNRISRIQGDSLTSAGMYAANTGNGNSYNNNTVYNLTNFNSAGAVSGIFMGRNTGGSTLNRNLVYDIHDYWNKNQGTPLYLGASAMSVANNIFAMNDSYHDIVYNNDVNREGIISLVSNIFYTDYGYYYHYFLERNFISLADSKNIIYHPNGGYSVYHPSGKITFAAWKNDYGFDRDSITGRNPQFREPSSGWFQVTDKDLAQSVGFNDISFSTGVPAGYNLYHATDRIEAENYSSGSGIEKQDTYITCPGNNSFVIYPRVFFMPGIHYAHIRLAVNRLEDIDLNTTLEIHGGNAAGPLLGRFPLKGTGNGKSAVYKIISMKVKEIPQGVQDICLLFREMAVNTDKIQVDWFEFAAKEESSVPQTQSPYVEIISPAPGSQVLVGQPVTIEARALIDDEIIDFMELIIDGKLTAHVSTGTLTYVWTEKTPGDYTILVDAYDINGNKGSQSITVSVKTSLSYGPEVTIISPVDKAYLQGMQDIDISVEATDTKSAVRVVEFYINGVVKFFDFEPDYKYTWPDVQPGEYSIVVCAINQKGYSTCRNISVLVNSNSSVLGHWTFDDYNSNIAKDSSGNGNNGRIVNAYPASGLNGGALNFTAQGTVFTDRPLMNNLDQFSMLGWIRPRTLKGRIGFWGQDGVVEFGFNGNKVIQLWTLNGGILEAALPFDKPDEWHHIAAVGDGSSIRLYIDGLLVKSGGHSIPLVYGAYDSSFNIGGAIFDPAGNEFDGIIDDVYLYSKAIPDAEIKWLARRNGNTLPAIKILNPADNALIDGPCNIRIKVMAGDQDSGVNRVDYYVNGDYLGTSSNAPYDYDWNGVMPHNYTVTATVVDNEDASASDSVFITVKMRGDDLICYWNFNENDPEKAYDQSGNKYLGTIINGSKVPGIDGNAMRLEGNGYMTTEAGLLNNLQEFTMAGWIKPEETGWRTGLWGQDGVIEFGFSDKQTVTVWTLAGAVSESYPFPMNEWHHVAAVRSNTSLMLYYDGKMAANNKQTIGGKVRSPWNFNIGGGGIFDSAGNYFTGSIDEVYVYRKALADEDIIALAGINSWKKPKVMISGLEDGMTLYYPFIATLTAEISNNNCSANTVEFFLNHQIVSTDADFPYEYIWNQQEAPANSKFLIDVKLTTACGFQAEDSITVNVASTEELKKQYAAEKGIQPDSDKKKAENNKTGDRPETSGINYYPRRTTGKSGNNSSGYISSVKDKEPGEESRPDSRTGAGSLNQAYTHNNADSLPAGKPEDRESMAYNNPGIERKESVKTVLPDRNNPGAVPPVIREISRAGIVVFLVAGIIVSILLAAYYLSGKTTGKSGRHAN